MTTIKIEDGLVLKFGGGVHSRASSDDIDLRECTDGANFELDLENNSFRNRKPFEKLITAPNGQSILGGGTLIKSDGTVQSFFQSGDTVYEYGSDGSLTSIATVNATSKLRGRLEHNWQLTDKVIVTDLTLGDVVMEWDGASFIDVSFTKEDPVSPTPFGTFKAKYCVVINERAYYFNVDDGTATPNLIIGSLRSDYSFLSTSNRPSSSLSAEDPFFLIQPDLRAINGAVGAFNTIATSSDGKGAVFQLTGVDATDFAMTPLFPRSGASGDEAVVYGGNDIFFGRASVIESLASTNRFGDVEADDLTVGISDKVKGFKDWVLVYNSETKRMYAFADGKSDLWVFHQSIFQSGGELSPWSKWTTIHPLKFQPTFVMNMLDPADGLEYVFMGDSDGNIYRLDGKSEGSDANTDTITTERLSGLFSMPMDAQAYDINGWVKYRKDQEGSLTIRLEYQGMNVFNEEIQLTLPQAVGTSFFGSGSFFGGTDVFGTLNFQKITRQLFAIPGRGNEFQIRVITTGPVEITEIGLRFEATS